MKKWLLRIGLGFLSLLVLLYLFVCLRSILPATVLDKDLRLERANIPEGSNAFDVLQVASSHFWWPDDAEREKYDAQKNSDFPMAGLSDWGKKTDHISAYLLSTTNWDDQLANTVLNNNRETLAAWDEAVGLPDLQVPEIFTVADLMSYLPNWKRLAQLAEVRENYLMHNGQEKAAFDQMVNQVMLGRKMQNSHSILIGDLVGTAVNSMGLNQIQRWAGKTQLTPRQLENYIRQLEQDPDESAAAYANTIKAEYQCQIGTLDAMRQGKLVDPDTGKNLIKAKPLLPVYNRSQTRALFANASLMLVKSAAHPYKDAKLPDFSNRPNPVALIFSGNLVGQVMYYMTMPAVIPSLAQKAKCDVQLQATRTILALRAYQLTHGNLPPDLNALVPEFLDEVPVDDFNGLPLHYSAEKKIVYSVGKNLKDDGGVERDPDAKPGQAQVDLVYKFDF